MRLVKVCTKCGSSLPFDNFNKDKSNPDGLSYWCRACVKEKYQRWYARNKNQERARSKTQRSQNPDKHLEYVKRWQARNPDKVKLQRHKRRVRSKATPGHCSPEQWRSRLAYYGYKCLYCSDRNNLHIDHRVPLSRGGTNWPANLAPVCASCNRRKYNLTEGEFKKKLCEK